MNSPDNERQAIRGVAQPRGTDWNLGAELFAASWQAAVTTELQEVEMARFVAAFPLVMHGNRTG